MSKRRRRNLEKRRRHAQTGGRTTRSRRLSAGAGLTVGATLTIAGTAQATDFTVDNTNDTGGNCPTVTTCTLRQAITDANTNSGPDDILFDSGLSGTITLGSDLPTITGPTDIQGPGAGQLTVNGTDDLQIISINQAVSGDPVSISGLTITNGAVLDSGGAVFSNDADLTISDAVVSSSRILVGGQGGGIASFGPSLTVERSTVSGNTTPGGGGDHGGGIYAYYQLYLVDSTVSGNTGSYGGGIYVAYSGGTIANPPAEHRGPHTIRNSTIVGNTATGSGGGVNFYGAQYESDRLTVESSTITGNNASGTNGNTHAGYGGGVASQNEGAGYLGAVLENTIVANNTALISEPDVSGDLLDASFSLIQGPGSAGITEGVPGSNITGVDPLLGPLQDNGGPTETMALALSSSPALDMGSAGALSTDQRGEQRPFDLPTITNSGAAGADGADIGAVEMQTLPPSPPVSPPATSPTSAPPKCKGKTATVFTRSGLARTLNGTNKRDVIVGTTKKDTIKAKGGNDLVCAKGGKDTVKGGGGKDKLYGQGGKDKLFGQGGADKLV
ncbi:MAG: choice-of-anchor Q domain-containing protein, partial [Actinomycetota bacterium]